MNDTVFAQIQLNGADNVSSYSGWADTLSGAPSNIDVREPYLKREGSYLYMYVGVGAGRAVQLRVKKADWASKAETVHLTRTENKGEVLVTTKSDGEGIAWFVGASDREKSAGNRTRPSISICNNYIIGTAGTSEGRPYMENFEIKLPGTSTAITGHSNNSSTISKVKLESISKVQLTTAVYGPSEPSGSAADGTLYFQISS